MTLFDKALRTVAVLGIVLIGLGLWRATTVEPKTRHGSVESNECLCGTARTCAFGPGIVGRQRCVTNVSMVNEWTRCEPAEETE